MWLKVKEVADKLGLGENFVRQAVCRAEFRGYCIFARPMMVKYCEEFKQLLAPLVKGHNFKRVRNNKHLKNVKPKEEKKISGNSLKCWTKSAIECYRINCNCQNCSIFEVIGTNCQMQDTVQKLLEKFGEPDNITN